MATGDGFVILAVKEAPAKPVKQSFLSFKPLSLINDEDKEANAAKAKKREELEALGREMERARWTAKAAADALKKRPIGRPPKPKVRHARVPYCTVYVCAWSITLL